MSNNDTEHGVPVVFVGWGTASATGLLLTVVTGNWAYLAILPWIGLILGVAWNEVASDDGNARLDCSLSTDTEDNHDAE